MAPFDPACPPPLPPPLQDPVEYDVALWNEGRDRKIVHIDLSERIRPPLLPPPLPATVLLPLAPPAASSVAGPDSRTALPPGTSCAAPPMHALTPTAMHTRTHPHPLTPTSCVRHFRPARPPCPPPLLRPPRSLPACSTG